MRCFQEDLPGLLELEGEKMRQIGPPGKREPLNSEVFAGKRAVNRLFLFLAEEALEKGRLEAIDLQAADLRQRHVRQINL